MKIKNLFLFIIGSTIILSSCGQTITGNVKLKTEMDSLSYSLGVDVSNSLKQNAIEGLNYDAFMKGMKDLNDDKLDLTTDQAREFLNNYFMKLQEIKAKEQEAKNVKNLEDGRAFLEENKKKEGVITTASGLQYEVIKEGAGISPIPTDTVVAHYHGTLIDGTVFESTIEGENKPVPFPLNRVIPGWIEGVQLMKVGSKYRFYIPTELAYGMNVRPGGKIEPNMALIFEIELLEIKKGPKGN